MKPISPKLLPHTITLFNVWKDPETGDIDCHRTILERVRVGVAKVSLTMARLSDMIGPPARYEFRVLIDRRTTRGYVDILGERLEKAYLPASDWEASSAKELYWTLRGSDLIYFKEGRAESICPEYDPEVEFQAFMGDHGLRSISDVPPVIDKDGTVHNWELILA